MAQSKQALSGLQQENLPVCLATGTITPQMQGALSRIRDFNGPLERAPGYLKNEVMHLLQLALTQLPNTGNKILSTKS